MNEKIEKELKIFIEKVKKKVDLKCVILFGSQARGEYSPYSDIDLIIIADFKENFFERMLKLSMLNESQFNFEIFCYTEIEFDNMFLNGNALILDSINDGVPLHGNSYFEIYKMRMKELIEKGLKKSKCTWILL